ncbi:hypothetical protein EVG20_g10135 [Dentipellis fragilis]|uniref:Thioredoxin domain-containing protein n=1 Tax=Dentipellis fragilis TaxID=205917 RepID=A0A4Y9XVK9_9AGAM|nr:hypothetical protein EVG20_g10135 [Dentipellis fragilis]
MYPRPSRWHRRELIDAVQSGSGAHHTHRRDAYSSARYSSHNLFVSSPVMKQTPGAAPSTAQTTGEGQEADSGINHLRSENDFNRLFGPHPKPAVIYFWRYRDIFCRKIDPIFDKLSRSQEFVGKVEFWKIDVLRHKGIWNRFCGGLGPAFRDRKMLPRFTFRGSDGKRNNGFAGTHEATLKKWIQGAINGILPPPSVPSTPALACVGKDEAVTDRIGAKRKNTAEESEEDGARKRSRTEKSGSNAAKINEPSRSSTSRTNQSLFHRTHRLPNPPSHNPHHRIHIRSSNTPASPSFAAWGTHLPHYVPAECTHAQADRGNAAPRDEAGSWHP